MIKVVFDLPEHDRLKLEASELGQHLRLSMQVPSLSHLDAVVWLRGAEGNPDRFNVFVQPNTQLCELRAGYHYRSTNLPFLTRQIFEDTEQCGSSLNSALDAFTKDLLAGELISASSSPSPE